MSDDVTLVLSKNEALVLHEWLARFNAGKGGDFQDQAEQRVLLDIETVLESALAEPFLEDYAHRLAEARGRVRDPIE